MMTTNIFLNYPDVTAITWVDPDGDGEREQVVLSAVTSTGVSMSQTIYGYAVDPRLYITRGIAKSPKTVSIVGIVSDDPEWGKLVMLGKYLEGNYSSPTIVTNRKLEKVFDKQILVDIDDNSTGFRSGYVLTSLDIVSSTTYKNASEYNITLTEQPFIKIYDQNEGLAERGGTVDPYAFYEYDVMGKFK
jgi:hypothetical protein